MNREANLGYLLSKAARLTKWELNNRLTDIGLTSTQWGLLHLLYQYKDTDFVATPAAIAEKLHSDRPTISGIIDRLNKNGWILRQTNPDDRRSQLISLTEKTLGLVSEMERLSDETMNSAVSDFSKKELEELARYLSRIINNLTTEK